MDYEAIDVSAGARGDPERDRRPYASGRSWAEDPHVVIANELLDNLPFRRVRGEREVRVGVSGDRFVEVETTWDGEPGSS